MKKRLISLLTILIIISQFIVPVSASEPVLWLTDDFNNFASGTDYAMAENSKFPVNRGKANELFVGSDDDGLGNFVTIDQSINASRSAGVIFSGGTSHNEVVTISFELRLLNDGVHYYIQNDRGQGFFNGYIRSNPYYHLGTANTDTYSSVGYGSNIIPQKRWVTMTTVVDFINDEIDLYCDGFPIFVNAKPRFGQDGTYLSSVKIYNDGNGSVKADLRNIKIYDGELIPQVSDYAIENFYRAEKQLVDFSDGINTIKTALPNAKAIFAGYPMAYNSTAYELISETNRALAPIQRDGYVFAPAEYVAKMLDASYDSQTSTITKGTVSASFVAGTVSDLCPVAPVTVAGELYIPVSDSLANHFGTSVYTDERGLAILGVSTTPGEGVIKPLMSELRARSAVFGKGINSEVLYTSRSHKSTSTETVWGSLDAAKRFMATTNRWTYTNTGDDRKKLDDLGILNQSTLNSNNKTPVYETDADGNIVYDDKGKPVQATDAKGIKIFKGSAITFEGFIHVRGDGLQNWGCSNNPFYLQDLKDQAKTSIDMGHYIWQFDDFVLNVNYDAGCFCDYCMKAFGEWLEQNYDLDTISTNVFDADEKAWITENGGLSKFNYKKYLVEYKGYVDEQGNPSLATLNKYRAIKKANGGINELHVYYDVFEWDCAQKIQQDLRAAMDEYAAANGFEIFMQSNQSNMPQEFFTTNRVRFFDVFDSGMGETDHKNTTPDALFGSLMAEQAYDRTYVNSLWAKEGRNSMHFWASAAPLMYATGQYGLIPWDDWVYNSTRYYVNLEELEGNYSFVREHPYLFDNYDTVQEVGYIFDMDNSDTIGITPFRNIALALAKKGVAYKGIATRDKNLGPKYSVEADDLEGLSEVAGVSSTSKKLVLTEAEKELTGYKGEIDLIAENGIDGTFETGSTPFSSSSIDSSNAYAGSKCLKLGSSVTATLSNTITTGIKPNTEYKLSLWTKGKDSLSFLGGSVSLLVTVTDTEGNELLSKQSSGTLSTSYANKTFTFTTKSNSTGIKITFNSGSADTIYIDNITLPGVIGNSLVYNTSTLELYQPYEQDYWTARMAKDSTGNFPKNTFAIMRKNTIYENAPVVVHATSYESAVQKNAKVELNNKYLPEGDTLKVNVYSPLKNVYTRTITKDASGVTTFTIDELDNWAILEIFGDNTESLARFDVDGFAGIGTGTRVSYDSASGTADDFTITTYGEGINCYTYGDIAAGQDEVGYVYKRIETDNFEVSASVEEIDGASGIMIREDVYSNSPAIALVYDSTNGLRVAMRTIVNRAFSYQKLGDEMPEYLKIKYNNGVVSVYGSQDGHSFDKLYQRNIYFTPAVAGAFASSASGEKTTCNVKDLTVSGTDSQIGYDIETENIMKIRNPSFTSSTLVDYVAGYNSLYGPVTETITDETGKETTVTYPSCVAQRSTTQSSDGDSYSLLIKDRLHNEASPWYRRLAVENGKTYEISAWIKVASEGADETAKLIVSLPESGETLNTIVYDGTISLQDIEEHETVLSTEWKRVYTRFTIPESGLARGVDFRIETTNANDIYIDNLALKEMFKIGDNLRGALTKVNQTAVLDLYTIDGTPMDLTYSIVMKDTKGNANERINYRGLEHLTITGETTSLEIDLKPITSGAEIQLWETNSFAPVIQSIKIRQ